MARDNDPGNLENWAMRCTAVDCQADFPMDSTSGDLNDHHAETDDHPGDPDFILTWIGMGPPRDNSQPEPIAFG